MCRLQFYRNIQKKSTNPSIRTLVSTLQCRFLCVFMILPYTHSAKAPGLVVCAARRGGRGFSAMRHKPRKAAADPRRGVVCGGLAARHVVMAAASGGPGRMSAAQCGIFSMCFLCGGWITHRRFPTGGGLQTARMKAYKEAACEQAASLYAWLLTPGQLHVRCGQIHRRRRESSST